jgi:hypothetical protein
MEKDIPEVYDMMSALRSKAAPIDHDSNNYLHCGLNCIKFSDRNYCE